MSIYSSWCHAWQYNGLRYIWFGHFGFVICDSVRDIELALRSWINICSTWTAREIPPNRIETPVQWTCLPCLRDAVASRCVDAISPCQCWSSSMLLWLTWVSYESHQRSNITGCYNQDRACCLWPSKCRTWVGDLINQFLRSGWRRSERKTQQRTTNEYHICQPEQYFQFTSCVGGEGLVQWSEDRL